MKIKKVSVIDYGMGNVYSVVSAFKYIGAEVKLVSTPEDILKSPALVLPGVGSFRRGMELLSINGLDEAIVDAMTNRGVKVLGICLGMQLMGAHSTEDGETYGLGFLPNRVKKFTERELVNKKNPHVGFNSLYNKEKKGLFAGLPDEADFYFTHSYRMLVDDFQGNYATCKYGINFMAAFQVDNVCGVQFHPEKSQTNGLIMLKNFIGL